MKKLIAVCSIFSLIFGLSIIPLTYETTSSLDFNVVENPSVLEVPDGYYEFTSNAVLIDHVYQDKITLSSEVTSSVQIENDTLFIPDNHFIGGEIIASNSLLFGHTFSRKTRILSVMGDNVCVDYPETTMLNFSFEMNGIPLDKETLSIYSESPYSNIALSIISIDFDTNNLKYNCKVKVENDGTIFNYQIFKIKYKISSFLIGGLLVNSSFISKSGDKNYLKVSTFYGKKEYYVLREISIISKYGLCSSISGKDIVANTKIIKNK